MAGVASTAGMITGGGCVFFVIQQILRAVRWKRSGWLFLCLSRRMSAALERKEVGIVSDRCAEMFRLVRLSSVQGEP